MPPPRVILLPGSVLPAALVYGPLLEALGAGVDAVARDLEVYSTPEPPEDYSLGRELGSESGGAGSLAGIRADRGATARAVHVDLRPARSQAGRRAASAPARRAAALDRQAPGRYPRLHAHLQEVFEERHHFDPPHRIEPERLASSLRALWRRAEGGQLV